jgi:hypothetical protein
LVINNWTAHAPVLNTSAAITWTQGQRVPIVVEHQELTGGAIIQLRWQLPGNTTFQTVPANRLYANTVVGAAGVQGLRGQYFNNTSFTGTPLLTRFELPAVDLISGLGPTQTLPSNNFAIRWEGGLNAAATGITTLRFNHRTDDGIRVWIDDTLVIDNWNVPSQTARTAALNVTAGSRQRLRIEFRDTSSAALFNVEWRLPGQTAFVRIPQSALTPPN